MNGLGLAQKPNFSHLLEGKDGTGRREGEGGEGKDEGRGRRGEVKNWRGRAGWEEGEGEEEERERTRGEGGEGKEGRERKGGKLMRMRKGGKQMRMRMRMRIASSSLASASVRLAGGRRGARGLGPGLALAPAERVRTAAARLQQPYGEARTTAHR